MTQTQFDPVQQREITQRATACVAFALSKDSHLRPAETPEDDIKRRGFSRYLSSKNADPLLTTDEGLEAPLNAALLTQVDQRSLIGQLIALGASRLGLSESLRLQVATVSATVVAESEPKPTTRPAFMLLDAAPQKAVAEIVASNEIFRSSDGVMQTGLTNIVTNAVEAATNAGVIGALTSGAGSPMPSASVASVLSAISQGAPQRPVVICGLDVALGLPLGTVQTLAALNIPIITTSAAAGLLIGLDVAGLAISDDRLVVQVARHADVTVSGSPPSTVNLWQSNLRSLRAERWFRLGVRADAFAFGEMEA